MTRKPVRLAGPKGNPFLQAVIEVLLSDPTFPEEFLWLEIRVPR